MIKTKTYKITFCALFAALTAIGAFIQIPVPYLDYFTLQFFFVLLAGILLGSKLGGTAVGIYVLTGLVGFPVFAAGGGIAYIFRPSFGYLIGFVAAAFVTGLVCEKTNATNFKQFLLAAFCGFGVTYAIGLVYKYCILNFYLGQKTPFGIIFLSCFPLDIPGDIVLAILAAAVGVRMKKALKGKI